MARSRSSRKGYGWRHQKLRKELLPYAYGQPCHFCGKLMMPGQKLDLDHTDDRTSYRGMTHQSCNRADGARKVNVARARKDVDRLRATRAADW